MRYPDVAVTGLPEPQEDHAIIMAKFARDCLNKMHEVTSALEVRLGPDTTELSMRFGLNSGQVTGGVLRGDRARFQLFGDTVNTAARYAKLGLDLCNSFSTHTAYVSRWYLCRMESTGERGRIQVSQSTADLILLAGRERWVRPRRESVTAKGKGTMQTYWLEMDGATKASSADGHKESRKLDTNGARAPLVPGLSTQDALTGPSKKQGRLVGWMTEVLLDYVKQIVSEAWGSTKNLSQQYPFSRSHKCLTTRFTGCKKSSTGYHNGLECLSKGITSNEQPIWKDMFG